MFMVAPKKAAMPTRAPSSRPRPTATSPSAISQPNQFWAWLSIRICRKLRYHSNVIDGLPVCGMATAPFQNPSNAEPPSCLLYTSDAADEEDSVDLGGR